MRASDVNAGSCRISLRQSPITAISQEGVAAKVGVNLRDLFPQHPVPEGWYQGKRIAVDGHNVAFRYLTSFRGRDGDVLRNRDGRPIGHLLGYVNLVRHLRERGAEPIVVWDGVVHPRKRATVDDRIDLRRGYEASVENVESELQRAKLLGPAAYGAMLKEELAADIRLLEALCLAPDGTAGDREELAERQAQFVASQNVPDAQHGAVRTVQLQGEIVLARRKVTTLSAKMIEDCSRLLEALGVAVVRADHDGERYATALCHAGFADAVATEDFDALVAGAPAVIRKAGSPEPFLHRIEDIQGHGLTLPQLRQIAILCGTDWHPGVKGFGAKTALKALATNSDLRQLFAQEGGRYHRMVAESGMSLQEFEELDAFIADLPRPTIAPRAPRPSPEMAVAVAEEMGVAPDRVLACFC